MANATTPGRSAPTLPGPPPPERDWPAQAADTIERVVGQVRDKTTGPALTAARAVVYGLFGGIVAIACLVVLIILLVRLLDMSPARQRLRHAPRVAGLPHPRHGVRRSRRGALVPPATAGRTADVTALRRMGRLTAVDFRTTKTGHQLQ